MASRVSAGVGASFKHKIEAKCSFFGASEVSSHWGGVFIQWVRILSENFSYLRCNKELLGIVLSGFAMVVNELLRNFEKKWVKY